MSNTSQPAPTLHILNKAPEHARFSTCLEALLPNDLLILSENAVLALARQNVTLPENCFALAPDLAARGLGSAFGEQAIGYQDLVQLTEKHPRIISW